MATAFDLQFSSGGFRSLLVHHGERFVYVPRDGAPREMTGIITRRELMSPLDGTLAPQVQLEALDDPTDEDYGGIDPAEVNSGGDKVELAWQQGGEIESRPVAKRIPSDGGVVRLEIH